MLAEYTCMTCSVHCTANSPNENRQCNRLQRWRRTGIIEENLFDGNLSTKEEEDLKAFQNAKKVLWRIVKVYRSGDIPCIELQKTNQLKQTNLTYYLGKGFGEVYGRRKYCSAAFFINHVLERKHIMNDSPVNAGKRTHYLGVSDD
jgi:hypothetical protein